MSDAEPADLFGSALAEGYRRCGGLRAAVLLAVSGGADSTALLVASAERAGELGLRLEVGCIDHGLRPEASAEAAAVRARSEALGIPCWVRRVALQTGAGLEARARAARYAALESLRCERGLDRIATAHTADDQAETLVMRLSRGAALRGSGGIRATAGRLIRPMLRIRRSDTRAFLTARGIGWSEDPMNADPAFLRVRIRQQVLPAITQASGPHALARMAAFAELAQEDDAFLSELAQAAWRRLACPEGLDAASVRALPGPIRRRVLVLLLEARAVKPSFGLLRQAEQVLVSGGRAELVRGAVLDARGGWLRWEGRPRVERPREVSLTLGQVARFGDFEVGAASEPPSDAAWTGAICADRLPVTVRPRRAGDRLRRGAHHRKLQDVMVDARVPRERRDLLPVFCGREGEPLWVGGVAGLTLRPPSGASVWLWARLRGEASEGPAPSL